MLSGDTEATTRAVEAVESYLESGAVPEDSHAAADFFSHVSLTAFRDMLTLQETQQLRAATLFSVPVLRPALAAAGEAASVTEPVRAIERLRGLGLMDLYLAGGAKEELAVNSLARPLVPPLSETESAQIAEKAIAPLYSGWKDAEGELPTDLRGLQAARLALLGEASPDILNASSVAAVVFLLHTLHQAEPALDLVLAALSALDRAKAVPDLHLLRLGADCAERLGKTEIQEMLLERGLAIEGGDPRARAMLLPAGASRLIRTGRIDAAEELEKEAASGLAAVALGKIADILQARGQLDEALKIRNEEQLPVYERLGDVRSLLVGRANLAINLLQRGADGDRDEAGRLLALALGDAQRLGLPEASQIEQIERTKSGPVSSEGPEQTSLPAEAQRGGNESLEEGYFADPGWDPVTGLGTPAGTNLIDLLRQSPSTATPFDPATAPPPAPPPPPVRGISERERTAGAPSQQPQTDKAEYLVWYGTNRRPNDPGNAGKGYSAIRDPSGIVHYGSCRVFIPQSHKIGSIGSPWWKRLLTWTDDRLRLLSVDEVELGVYWSDIGARLAALDADERNALIFVHGYNVSFQEAALRAAQIGFDLSVKGAMAFFSWPSQGSTGAYPADEATIEASEGVIADFMTDFAERSDATAVHIIAHSMGNRGVLRAVNRIAAKAQQQTGKPFGQVILAAADVDADVFRQLSTAYAQVAARTTLYVSKRDRAVEASRWLHNFSRAGLMPPTWFCRASTRSM
jgi:esterase/lipase superfamily enzyme